MAQETRSEGFESFSDFYPYYLSQHAHSTCRRLHVVGTGLVLVAIVVLVATRSWWVLLAIPVLGYGFAWVGHFFFEKNHPATFEHPLYSLIGDFRMFGEVVTGRRRF